MKSQYVGEWILIKPFGEEHPIRVKVLRTRQEMMVWVYVVTTEDGSIFEIPCDGWSAVGRSKKAKVQKIRRKLKLLK